MSGTNVTDSYTLKLVDQILSPLNGILKQAEKVNATLERMENLTSKGLGFAKMAGGIGLAVGGLMVLKSALGAVVTVLEKAAEGALHFGRSVIEAARFSQQNKTALDLFLGKGTGERTFDRALKFGNILPMSEIDLVNQVTSLASAGYQGKQLDAVNAALADVFALRGERYRANLEFHFLRLKNEAKPDARDVKMAAIDTGVGMEGIMKHLFRLKGVKIPAGIFAMENLYEEMKKEGKVTGNDVANAILHGINERMDEGKGLGSAAKKLGLGTLSGLLSNLEAAPMRFLAQIGVEKFRGIKSLMDFLKRVLEFFDLDTKHGQQLAKTVEQLINALFGGLDRIGQNDLGRFFEAGVRMAERLLKVVEKITGEGGLLDQIVHGDWDGLLKAASGTVLAIGRLVGQGIWEGIHILPEFSAKKGVKDLGGAAGDFGAFLSRGGKQIWGWHGASDRMGLGTGANEFVGKGVSDLAGAAKAVGAFFQRGVGQLGVPDVGKGLSEVAGGASAVGNFFGRGVDQLRGIEQRGAEIPLAIRKGMDDASQRHSPPALFVDAGAEYVDALHMGIRRRISELQNGSTEADAFLDHLIEALRGSAERLGAEVT